MASYMTIGGLSTAHPGDWLTPRRRIYAERLLGEVWWRGRKMILDDDGQWQLTRALGWDRWQLELAMSDLYRLGAIDLRQIGERVVLAALVAELEELPATMMIPATPPPRRSPPPKPNGHPPSRNGHRATATVPAPMIVPAPDPDLVEGGGRWHD